MVHELTSLSTSEKNLREHLTALHKLRSSHVGQFCPRKEAPADEFVKEVSVVLKLSWRTRHMPKDKRKGKCYLHIDKGYIQQIINFALSRDPRQNSTEYY